MNIYELSFQRKTAAWQPAVDAGVFHCVFFTDKRIAHSTADFSFSQLLSSKSWKLHAPSVMKQRRKPPEHTAKQESLFQSV